MQRGSITIRNGLRAVSPQGEDILYPFSLQLLNDVAHLLLRRRCTSQMSQARDSHVLNMCKKDDIANLKMKVDCGVDFLTTQMFFDNNILYNFLYMHKSDEPGS